LFAIIITKIVKPYFM